jgi:hypothetical protein
MGTRRERGRRREKRGFESAMAATEHWKPTRV